MSKQPTFKSDAVRVERLPQQNGSASHQIHAREGHTDCVKAVERRKIEASEAGEAEPRDRHLELWLGATYEAIVVLLDAYEHLVPTLLHDLEILAGLRKMRQISGDSQAALRPFVDKYHADDTYGKNISKGLRDSLFVYRETNAYEALATLLALYVYLSNVEGHLVALETASAALWDAEFVEAVERVSANNARNQAWVKHQMTVRSPQTLVVPSKVLREDMQ